MTPKEKALELVESMAFSCRECDYEAKAKQCALISVDEMIDRLTWHTGASDLGNTILVGDIAYWNEVKQEIENL
jgi:hypothetical protein